MSRPEAKNRSSVEEGTTPLLSTDIVNEMPKPKLSTKQKFGLMVKLLPYMTPLALVYFAEYLVNQSVDPVLNFPHDKLFSGKEYVYYQVILTHTFPPPNLKGYLSSGSIH